MDRILDRSTAGTRNDIKDFLKTPTEMLSALLDSQQANKAIGILCQQLGPTIYVTAVDDILLEDGETTIVLKHYDRTGYILPSTRINLKDIEAVYPFTSEFKNPFLENVEKDKNWFF